MPRQRYRGPPTRANGVRSLAVHCWLCHHKAVLAVDTWSNDVPVPSFGPRIVSTGCGIISADARPNWSERAERPTLTGDPVAALIARRSSLGR